MIYTCTLNPSVDYIIHVAQFKSGGLNRGEKSFYYPGGKGINVSRVLTRLDVKNTALGFVGGFTGEFIKSELINEGIHTDFIELTGKTRINMKLKSDSETEINGSGPDISEIQLQQLFNRVKGLSNGDILVASGSIPNSVPDDIYSQLATICNEKGIKMIADTSSKALKEIVGHDLFLIKPNQHELEELFNTTITSLTDALDYGLKLNQKGATHVIVSMGGQGAVYTSEDNQFIASVPTGTVQNTVGAGDSMVAGFLAAYSKNNEPLEAFKYAVAAGSSTAFSEDLCKKEDVEELVKKIVVKTM
ncbi:1-phosphofructokinase [Aquibacillus halophilus]|uniref:Tagatose-6-phosphate kinase n=1 Tax=Aquibacillus halophilus TaxID=930132 RepID=A0A6A8DBY7_9BACI|nr:1-phosphofructokinase [Aquibacillus halophilus]MRH42046.1 1-phosphofructokinase [Aquibacillus halophilus]